jgi:hypothetical protein
MGNWADSDESQDLGKTRVNRISLCSSLVAQVPRRYGSVLRNDTVVEEDETRRDAMASRSRRTCTVTCGLVKQAQQVVHWLT